MYDDSNDVILMSVQIRVRGIDRFWTSVRIMWLKSNIFPHGARLTFKNFYYRINC